MQKYLIIILSVLLFSCKRDDYSLNTNLQPVPKLTAPLDNKYIKLQPTTSATVSFEWDQARAEDGSLVMYEVAFDKADGDFSSPVAKYSSDGGGVQNRLTLSHKDLNSIAGKAGIASLATGKLKWTVLASKGYNIQKAAESKTIEVERPNGFAEIPTDVYLTGEATEAGADLSKALKLKSTAPGVYEIYTSLKNGKYHFTNRNTGTPSTYSVMGTAVKEGGESEQTAGTKVYRLRLDFNNAAATVTEITSIGLWFAPLNKFLFEISYAGNSTWSIKSQLITFKQESWGRDERYKFRIAVKDSDGNAGDEWIGSSNADNSRPTSATPLSYWELKPISNNDQWNYCYKFATEADTKNCDINVYFTADKNYTHEVIVK
ncbi:SusE-like outer membrane protein [Chitinophaga polysaccharea]|uniref:SusE-like outer membrane protein n=1 Tax=Chitinophaga polysaccharea TaxID=1293035 RepID=A0A561PB48_9BACT|nr:SusE domain-containing protein [Chitinophaga polysaccharea]TWF35298.1 SusE-like outer membrane protein [Chitinophaga polysaccharea]